MSDIQLVLGAGQIDRLIENPDYWLQKYRKDIGCSYLDHRSITPQDVVVPEDLAVTLLVNSQAGYRAFQSLQQYGMSLDLKSLPLKPLEQTTPDERIIVRDMIVIMCLISCPLETLHGC
jgi:hypothetical protein